MPHFLQVGPAEVPGGDRTFAVKENVDITLYAAVIQSSGGPGEVDMPGAAGQASWGFAQEACDYSEGQHHVLVRTLGFSHAIAYDNSITPGQYLQIADSLGRVVAADEGDYVIARAVTGSSAANDIIVVQVLTGGYLIYEAPG